MKGLPGTWPVTIRPAGSLLTRIHKTADDALHFSRRSRARFNSPAGEYGVCYLGESLETAFLETLVRGNALRIVPRADLASRSASTVVLRRELRLLQLHSEGLVFLGLDAAFPHWAEYAECQQLAFEVWERHPGIDGIEYRSRWNDRLHCVALYDRAAGSVEVVGSMKLLSDLAPVRTILRRYDIGVI